MRAPNNEPFRNVIGWSYGDYSSSSSASDIDFFSVSRKVTPVYTLVAGLTEGLSPATKSSRWRDRTPVGRGQAVDYQDDRWSGCRLSGGAETPPPLTDGGVVYGPIAKRPATRPA